MKGLVSMHILCLSILIACANNNNQIPKSLSSSYDGIWDGYTQAAVFEQAPNSVYIKAEIKNGIVLGFVGEMKINGYINSDNNLIIKPFYIYRGWFGSYKPPDKIIVETNFMSPNRIEGTYHIVQFAEAPKYDWYIVKPATGRQHNL